MIPAAAEKSTVRLPAMSLASAAAHTVALMASGFTSTASLMPATGKPGCSRSVIV